MKPPLMRWDAVRTCLLRCFFGAGEAEYLLSPRLSRRFTDVLAVPEERNVRHLHSEN